MGAEGKKPLHPKNKNMKKLFIAITILLISLIGQAQERQTPTPQGKVYNLDAAKKGQTQAKETTNTAIYQGKKYPVYISRNGKLFIKVISKTGNPYNKYIPEN